MYAIVSTGGKQYKVAKGDVIDVEKLDAQPGDKVKLDVLMLNDGKKVIVDAAILEKSKVTCKVVEQFKGDKQLVFKFQKRKRHHKLNGHRQNLTKLEVVTVPSGKAAPKKAATTEKSDAEAPKTTK
jgi:large subunit ribosomal protein L21